MSTGRPLSELSEAELSRAFQADAREFLGLGSVVVIPATRRKDARLQWICPGCGWRTNRWQSSEKMEEQVEDHFIEHIEQHQAEHQELVEA